MYFNILIMIRYIFNCFMTSIKMKLNNNQKDWLSWIIIILIMWGITFLFYFLSSFKYKTDIISPQTSEEEEPPVINNSSSIKNSWDINISEDIFYEWSCDIKTTWNFKFIDIATPTNRIYTPENTHKIETKTINISWDIEDAYLCIISDISDKKESYNDYRKWFNAVTKVIFWEYRWAINVGYSKNNQQFYDYDWNNIWSVSKQLNWKFWTNEAPFRYFINLKSVILANEKDWKYDYFPLINELKDGKTIEIGWYMTKLWNDAYRASSISYYRLIWKWDWTINIK